MYAIIQEDGKQIKVEQGQELRIDFRFEASVGDALTFDQVLLVSGEDGVKIGKPVVDGASVKAEVLGVVQGEKLVVQKFRRRKNSKTKTGHRQVYTKVKISEIVA
ncbi:MULTISPECIES: 50S ribosomal protein L21 [Pirellulaceae]|uniref:Large ribosomal subunit protein bL21 n=2 Tax=Pirellulaceae TaxID=2691357 RepID=A0A2S8FHC3_9BACT|nr:MULTISPECIES: 50S ribosomal protein L21 [Pirellulaceae]PQO31557.1 50S ribosomal protein L21 [Blastopirellula marina]PTL42863.1 50S ribosomal protein L21 [Blastopirellula marina]RCS40499.1 50S ribosomal protein L21 [Bremerella cremea]